jgi:Fur family transcriptional regulator, stress-responsive regulator
MSTPAYTRKAAEVTPRRARDPGVAWSYSKKRSIPNKCYGAAVQLAADEVADALRRHSLRVTASRIAVYGAVAALPGHPDVESIAARVRDQLGAVSTQAVYDGLRALTTVGLLRRIEPAGSPARYETRVGDNHHHVVCRSCGAIADVDCAIGEAPCLTASDDSGFAIDEAEVIYWGLCPDCSNANAT